MNIQNKITAKFLNRKNGLPSGQVQDIVQDSKNIFWFAGPNGLAKYDGTRIRAFNQKDGLATHGLRSINASKDGNIWVGSDLGVDVIEPDGGIHSLVGVGEWNYGFVECIEIAQDNTIWLGTSEGLLTWTESNGLQPVNYLNLQAGLITSLLISKSGLVLVSGVKSGLLKYDSGEWVSPGNTDWKNNEKVGLVLSIAEGIGSEAEEIFFIGGEKGLIQIDSDGNSVEPLFVDNSEAVTAILQVKDELWLGIGGQLRVYRKFEDMWRQEQVILENAFVNKLYEDSIGNIWGATDSFGVVKISALRKAIIQPILPKSKAIFAIRKTSDEQFLLGGDQCSWKIDLKEELTAEKIVDLSGIKVWDIIEEKQKAMLVATEVGLHRISFQGDKRKKIGANNAILSSPGRVLVKHKNSTWIGTVSGLIEFKDDEFKQITDNKNRTLGYVYTLAEDSGKNIWIGTLGNGLWRETASGIKKIENKEIKPFGNIYDIEFSNDGKMAVIHDDKVIIMNPSGKLIKVIETTDSVAGWSALWLGNSIWVGSSSGLHEYDPISGKQIRRITSLTGVANWEFTTSRSLQSDQNGRLLCGLNGGLTIVDVEQLETFNEIPLVKTDSIKWSNAIIEKEFENNEGFIVAPGKWTLDVEAYVASFIDEGDTWVRFRLVGFDKSWQEYKKSARIQYNSLPPGKYTLEAQAYIPLIGEGEVAKLFDLQVQQPWWSKGWFALPYAASEAVLGLIEARWRNRRLLERNFRLEERVQERTKEIEIANKALQKLNHELQIVSATDSLTGVANRRQFDEVFDKELERARRSESHLSLVLMDIDFFKAYNDNYGHVLGDECLQLIAQTMVKSFRSGGDMVARYGGEEFVAILPDTDLKGALVITERIRETIENLKIPHIGSSVADSVTLSLGVASSGFSLTTSPGQLSKIKEKLIATADKALYQAKNSGRNRISSEIVISDH